MTSRPPLLPRAWIAPYVLVWVTVASLLSIAALQDYHRRHGPHDWEPFLWEFSSVACIALLALATHAWVRALAGRPWPTQAAGHVLGLASFAALHICGMFGLRFLTYGALGMDYDAGPWPRIVVYESAKDAITYASFVLISRGVWEAQARSALERALNEARLARLSDQVQPHFLFNTLNLVASVMYEDVPRADRLLCQLADLLRQTLAAQQRVMHSVAEELALVAPFLSLMQARFGPERLAVRIDAEAAAAVCELPALLLLAPVENAIKHDVARQRGRVDVHVEARREGDELRLSVSNFSDPAAARVDDAATTNDGHGLRNLRERLAARYGAKARVEFGPVAGGMRLAIALPAARSDLVPDRGQVLHAQDLTPDSQRGVR